MMVNVLEDVTSIDLVLAIFVVEVKVVAMSWSCAHWFKSVRY